MNTSNLSIDQLKRAVQLKEQIDALESQLAAVLGGSSNGAAGNGKRHMSAAARAKIAAAQRARWARTKGGSKLAKPVKAAGGKRRTMSPAAKAKIAAAARARWAKAKAAGRNAL